MPADRRATGAVAVQLPAKRWPTDSLGLGELWSARQVSGRQEPKSTLSGFLRTRRRAAEPTEKRLDGIDQMVHSGSGNLGCRSTRSSSQTDGGVGACG